MRSSLIEIITLTYDQGFFIKIFQKRRHSPGCFYEMKIERVFEKFSPNEKESPYTSIDLYYVSI